MYEVLLVRASILGKMVRYQRKYGGPGTFHRMKVLAMIIVGIIMITIIIEIISRLIATKTKIKQLPQL